MTSSPLTPLALAIGAALADGGGFHRLAFYLVLLAVPAAAAVALAAAGELVDGHPVAARTACAAAALVLLVVSSAVRANAAVGATLPPLALSALVGCLGSYVLLGLLWLLWTPRTVALGDPSSG